MDTTTVEALARTLMNEHGFGYLPFEFDRAKNRIAATWHDRSTLVVHKISFSRHFVGMTEDEVRYVILHEIAHAKAPGDDHGWRWARQCEKLGIEAKPCHDASVEVTPIWTSRCPAGHEGTSMHRAPGVVRSCAKCHPHTFSFNHIFVWFKNGTPMGPTQISAKYTSGYLNAKRRYGMVTA